MLSGRSDPEGVPRAPRGSRPPLAGEHSRSILKEPDYTLLTVAVEGRDDQVGYALFSPVDSVEARLTGEAPSYER